MIAEHDGITRGQRRHNAGSASLPDGAFVLLGGRAHLAWGGQALPYAPEGYGAPCPLPSGPVTVLTPEPLVAVMRAGWRPVLDAAQDRAGW